MPTREFFTWKQFDVGVAKLSEGIRHCEVPLSNIYGVPRGGLILAVSLSHFLELPLAREIGPETLVVDDISDSGKTLLSVPLSALTATIHYVKSSAFEPSYWAFERADDCWIVYPWERDGTEDLDLSLQWLAGFYEEEGSPEKSRYFGLRISQKERTVLERITEYYGGGVRCLSRSPYHFWYLNGNKAVGLALRLLPYMHSDYKIEQLTHALVVTGCLDPRTDAEVVEVTNWKEKQLHHDRISRGEYRKTRYQLTRANVLKWIREHPEEADKIMKEKGGNHVDGSS